jgi:cutinase
MHSAVGGLPPALKSKVVGGVLFGDTKNKQDHGQVPNYPKEQVTIYCDKNDGVCGGGLVCQYLLKEDEFAQANA